MPIAVAAKSEVVFRSCRGPAEIMPVCLRKIGLSAHRPEGKKAGWSHADVRIGAVAPSP